MHQIPSIGRIVHFLVDNSGVLESRAGIIVAVHNDECINVVHWNAGGTASCATSVLVGTAAGCWCWPPRVDASTAARV